MNTPTISDLDNIAHEINERLSEICIDSLLLEEEKQKDTVAIGLLSNDEFVLAVNKKDRQVVWSEQNLENFIRKTISLPNGISARGFLIYTDFGIRTTDKINAAIDILRSHLGDKFTITIIEEAAISNNLKMVDKAKEHASNHAEMKILKYAENAKLEVLRIGISKPACLKCFDVLTQSNILVRSPAGGCKISHWRHYTDPRMKISIVYQVSV